MKQIFSNNATTTLLSSIVPASNTILLTDGSAFPVPGPNEFFALTVELGAQREIIYCNTRIGNTVGVFLRGAEGTTPLSLPAGSKAENRVTKQTLSTNIRAFVSLPSPDDVVPPKDAFSESYILEYTDPAGAPAMIIRKADEEWSFLNYTKVGSGLISASTTTSVTFSQASSATDVTPGKYVVQINGYIRGVLSQSSNTLTWTTAMGSAPSIGDTAILYKANSSLADVVQVVDDAFVIALIMSN